MRRLFALALLMLAGCGAKGPLQWPEASPPPAPVGETAPLTSDKMLTPPPQAAPERADDPVKRSEERREDRFELPPD